MTRPIHRPAPWLGTLLIATLAAACAQTDGAGAPPPEAGKPAHAVAAGDKAALEPVDDRTAPLLEGIGPLHFPITTDVPRAQAYFDQALTLAFGFNHAEAVRSFREAARLDPSCGICFWGVALALGPNINAPMGEQAVAPAWEAVQQALALRDNEAPYEQAYIDAVATRYSDTGEDRATLDLLYAGAMDGLVKAYPDDLHARTLHAEALMDLMPWEYWNDDGTPANHHTVTLVEELEHVLARNPEHPGAAHLYIHAMERFEPEKAEAAADTLGPLVPVAGHLVHMPSHIYLRVGRYADAVDANAKASMADEDYIAQCNAQGLYPAAYYPHNIHFLWYAAMMEGRRALAVDSALKLAERVPMAMAKQMGALQSYLAVPAYTYVRFGLWQDMLALPEPAQDVPFALAMHLYGRGMAQAATGDVAAAQATLTALAQLADSEALQSTNMRREGVMEDLLAIATALVQARVHRAKGDNTAEVTSLAQAVAAQDRLPYAEPPLWHFPVRQALGEAQLRAGDATAAQASFAADLKHFPKNPWSLLGLREADTALGRDSADTAAATADAWRNADIEPAIVW